jgi:hypothetical protein
MEEAKQESTKRRATMEIARPFQPMDIINQVVTVLYRYSTPVMYKDISAACKMHPVTVSQGLSAARDVGLTDLSGKKGLYILTKEGEEYAMLLTAGKGREAKDVLRNLLKRNPLWTEIVRFLAATRGQSRDPLDLVLEIERITGKHWSGMTRSRLRDSLVSILESADMVIREGSKIISVAEGQIKREKEEAEAKQVVTVDDRVLETRSALSPSSSKMEQDFAILRGDDFTFEVRRDLDALEFAKKQFADWIEYIKDKLNKEKQEARHSGGVPNQ